MAHGTLIKYLSEQRRNVWSRRTVHSAVDGSSRCSAAPCAVVSWRGVPWAPVYRNCSHTSVLSLKSVLSCMLCTMCTRNMILRAFTTPYHGPPWAGWPARPRGYTAQRYASNGPRVSMSRSMWVVAAAQAPQHLPCATTAHSRVAPAR